MEVHKEIVVTHDDAQIAARKLLQWEAGKNVTYACLSPLTPLIRELGWCQDWAETVSPDGRCTTTFEEEKQDPEQRQIALVYAMIVTLYEAAGGVIEWDRVIADVVAARMSDG